MGAYLRRLIPLLAFALALAAPAFAQTFIALQSQPGDYIGQGLTQTYTPADGTFFATGSSGVIQLQYNSGTAWWNAKFAAPPGSELVPGDYPFAVRAAFPQAGSPGLEFTGSGRGCNSISGRFTLYEVMSSGPSVQSFAVDFEQHCDGGPALFGRIRFNSAVPLVPPNPIASAIAPKTAETGALVTLNGTTSYDPGGSALSYSWTQLSGPSVVLSTPTAAMASFIAPPVPIGGLDVVFQLRVTNAANLSATKTVTVRATNPLDPKSQIHFKSEAGDYIGQGNTATYTPALGTFTASQNYASGVTVQFNNGGSVQWYASFAAPNGVPLAVGEYPNALALGVQGTRAGLSFSGSGRACTTLTGRFVVHEVVVVGGVVESFAADFEQHCEGAVPALFGAVRYRSAVPLKPFKPAVSAVAPANVEVGVTVTLDGSASRDPNGTTITHSWTQVSGPPVTIASPSAAVASFVAPAVPLGGTDFAFELRVTNAALDWSAEQVTVHVRNAADPRTFIHFRSDPGDYIGQGMTRTYTPLDGGISATPSNGGVNVSFNGGGPTWTYWNGSFYPPTGSTLAPGDYLNAERAPFHSPTKPGLEFTGSGRGCNTLTGRFTVWEVSIVNGVVQSFAVDFEQHCEGGAPALYGSIRYNSTIPLVPVNPIASATATTDVNPGTTVTLDGSPSRDPGGSALTYAWTQVSGTPATILSPNNAVASFVAPTVPLGGSDLVFELRVTNTSGNSSTARVTVHVANPADPRTLIRLLSEAGDYIGQGITRTYTPQDGSFSASGNSNGLTVSFSGGGSSWWYARFEAPAGQVLAPGIYVNAERAAFHSPARPGLDFSGSGRGCNTLTGRFIVYEYVVVNNVVQSFAADFEQHCEGGTPALFGSVRYNSTVPLVPPYPVASAVSQANVEAGATVTLDGSASRDPGGSALTYLWSQVSGPSVTINFASSSLASFVAPAVPLGGADLVFEILVTNVGGTASTARTTVHVANPNDPKTFLHYKSDPGDYIGGGQTRTYTPQDGTFSAQSNYGDFSRGISIYFNGGSTWWTASFAAPNGVPLAPGDYPIATRFPFQSPTHAGLDFSGSGRGCNTSTGRFTVYEYVVVGGVVQSFAADFEQHCEGGTPALYGSVRYKSTVPLQPVKPVASALAPASAEVGATVTLNGSASRDPNGSPLTYGWAQVSGTTATISNANAAVASFVAPAVPFGGSDLAFELTVTNGTGHSASTRVTVHVSHPADPRTAIHMKSDPGDYIGQGVTRTYTPQDGSFSIGGGPGGVTLYFNGGNTWWNASFLPADGGSLQPGATYLNAERAAFHSPTKPGLEFTGSGRGCNTIRGSFTVHELVVSGGVVQRFAVDFEQHCEGGSAALFGGVRYNSSVPYPAPTVPANLATRLERVFVIAQPYVLHGATMGVGFSVRARNSQGVPVQGARVSFAVQNGCGTLGGSPSIDVLTNADGIATPPFFTAGNVSARCVTRASLAGDTSPVEFEMLVYNDSDLSLAPVPGPTIAATVNQSFQAGVIVRWQGSIPMAGLSVKFQQNAFFGAAASGMPSGLITDINGRAVANLIANPVAGYYDLVMSVGTAARTITVSQVAAGSPTPTVTPQVQDMWWGGSAQNGWGLSIVQHGEKLFAVIYGYDAAGQPTWWVMPEGTWNDARTMYSGAVYSPRGTPFYAYDASRFVAGTPVGSVTLRFTDANQGTLFYSIEGASGSKAITRQLFGTAAQWAPEGLGDMWWGGQVQNGWGIAVLQQYGMLFSVWFTYDAAGMPRWYVMPAGNWVAGTYEGRLYRTTSSPWLTGYNAAMFQVIDVGSYRLRFDNGNATFEYTVDGLNGSLSLTRQLF